MKTWSPPSSGALTLPSRSEGQQGDRGHVGAWDVWSLELKEGGGFAAGNV
jgi:hypothetical protein